MSLSTTTNQEITTKETNMQCGSTVSATTPYTNESLANRIRAASNRMSELKEQGQFREMHTEARNAWLQQAQPWIQNAWAKRYHWFANGKDINPEKIAPQLLLVKTTEEKDLFRLARYTWSLPYSRGYGRRLRFLIKDEEHDKLIGILGLQSPPINFLPRDEKIRYPETLKVEMVNQTMDAFTLGAVPPYNRLLGGKLIICAAASKEVVKDYQEKYAEATTWLNRETLPPQLVMITTTSAFGRSSIYNRVFYENDKGHRRPLAEQLGYTKGYGNFHLHQVYQDIKNFLTDQGYEDVNKGYGRGPKPVWQNISKTLTMLGISHERLNHGIPRQAWSIPLARNAWEYLSGEDQEPDYYDIPFHRLAEWWKRRWLLPRSRRISDWKDWRREFLLQSITVTK